jgi:hypothetical protein
MNLFRGEEHVARWALLNPVAATEGLIPLADLAAWFGMESRRHLLDDDYLSRWYPERDRERRAAMERLGKATPFWLGS